MSEELRGYVQKVIYSAPKDDFCVFSLVDYNEDSKIVTANTAPPRVGDELVIKGYYTVHKKFGKQFKATLFEQLMPESYDGALRYIWRLNIKGLGDKSLERIGAYFGEELPTIIKEDPKALLDVPAVRTSVKEALYETIIGEGFLKQINSFLEEHGISTKFGKPLFDMHGEYAVMIIKENPYDLMKQFPDFTFQMADRLASDLGFVKDDEKRLAAGIVWILSGITNDGHTCLPVEELLERAEVLLGGLIEEIANELVELVNESTIFVSEYDGIQYVYTAEVFLAEAVGVARTQEFLEDDEYVEMSFFEEFLNSFQEKENIVLGNQQIEGVALALNNKISIITGGPGTGKTTVIKALVEAFERNDLNKIILCAPTGRAVKRLSDATGVAAITIHRLLGPVGVGGYEFIKNEIDPLDAEVVIVDEASMLNVQLYKALLDAIPPGAFLILVGDVNQLPPIGAGFVLRDLIDSETIPTSYLYDIYRQEEGNTIIENAYLVNAGIMPDLTEKEDFAFYSVNNMNDMLSVVAREYDDAIERGENPLDVQIISPMRRRAVGSYEISKKMQNHIMKNVLYQHDVLEISEGIELDEDDGKRVLSIKIDGQTFFVGDKIIQNKNNYELDVFNGEIGIIYAITKRYIFVQFPDKDIKIPVNDANGISLAYAITVHKSQGSEYSTVIVPFIRAHGPMLQRNLLYTAITRAKNRVVIVGTKQAIEKAIQTVSGKNRYSLFKERLLNLVE